MRKLIIATFAACVAMSGAAWAGALDPFFGNTIVTTIDGANTLWLFEPDGTFTFVTPDGQGGAGAWAFANNQLCVTPAGGEMLCTQVPEGKSAGDSWESVNNAGQNFTMTIQAGRTP
jgi:hypothetical protein